MSATAPAIEIRDLYKVYGLHPKQVLDQIHANPSAPVDSGHVLALSDINLSIAPGKICVIMGLSGSGKSTLARGLERRLFALGCRTVLLDGDALRRGLSNDLGFSPADRMENIRRASEVARLFYENGCLVLCAFVSPFRRDRAFARQGIGRGRFFEIHVDCPIEECRRRDTKGLYAAARAGALGDLTGVGQAYEPPQAPEWVARTAERTPEAVVEELVALLRARGLLPAARTPRAR